MSIAETKTITPEMLLAMPDDGMERWLVEGELREKPMTKRNFMHSAVMSTISFLLVNWLRQFNRTGQIFSGEVGVILSRNPATNVGIDVAYFTEKALLARSSDTTMLDVPPLLAVEILSPSDTTQNIAEKIDLYLKYGVKLVWIVEPMHKTITVYEASNPPIMFNITQTITAEPHLPNFAAPLTEIFAGC